MSACPPYYVLLVSYKLGLCEISAFYAEVRGFFLSGCHGQRMQMLIISNMLHIVCGEITVRKSLTVVSP